jgi:hypothetical protein
MQLGEVERIGGAGRVRLIFVPLMRTLPRSADRC